MLRILRDIDTEHGRTPGVRTQQGGEHADGGCLARAVRPEQTEDAALGHSKVEAVEGAGFAEGLPHTLGKDGICHNSQPIG